MEIYFKGEPSLDALAERLRELLNISSQNKSSSQLSQIRDGANMGGEYFLFEIFGLTLRLLNNTGEVLIPERKSWPYYLMLEANASVDPLIIDSIAEYLAQLARSAGMEAEVDSLSF